MKKKDQMIMSSKKTMNMNEFKQRENEPSDTSLLLSTMDKITEKYDEVFKKLAE